MSGNYEAKRKQRADTGEPRRGAESVTVRHIQLRRLYSLLCGDLNGKKVQERGAICVNICTADSLCCTMETNTVLYSNRQ